MMKKLFPLVVLAVLIGCSSAGEITNYRSKEVRFFKATIGEVYRQTITLTDHSVWRAGRIVIAANLSNTFFVVDDALETGTIYLNNVKMKAAHVSGEYVYNLGYLNYLKNINDDGSQFEMSDGSIWGVAGKENFSKLIEWYATKDIVLTRDEDAIINPYTIDYIPVFAISKDYKK